MMMIKMCMHNALDNVVAAVVRLRLNQRIYANLYQIHLVCLFREFTKKFSARTTITELFFRILHCSGFIIALQKVLCTLGLILVFNLQYVLLLFFAVLRSALRPQSTAGRYAALKLQQDNKCFVFSSRIYIHNKCSRM